MPKNRHAADFNHWLRAGGRFLRDSSAETASKDDDFHLSGKIPKRNFYLIDILNIKCDTKLFVLYEGLE